MIKKCILLSAGLGTRLQPVTNNIPKCLVPIHGIPLLGYWLTLLEKHGITSVLINTHHLHQKVYEYIDSISTSMDIVITYEKSLLGSYGTIIHNNSFYEDEESILVVNADNLTNINLSKFIECHESHDFRATIALQNTDKPTQCGIVELDKHNKIIAFEEKPVYPKSNLSNAGIYIFDTLLLEGVLIKKDLLDIGYDLLPKLSRKSYGYLLKDFLMDVGSYDDLDRANKIPYETFSYMPPL
jgi:mannose-1-phosphate guanylyltransferase